MVLGFALTGHCNLRCPHCIRDDVVSVQELEPALIARVVTEAVELWGAGEVKVSLTGGEPLVHRHFAEIVEHVGERGLPYYFVSNAWHLKRIVPLLARWPAAAVRLSLSGADEVVHDAERGQGSYRRVLLGVALLTHLGIPASLSIVIDRRSRHQVRSAADLAEALGCVGIHFILPQPVPGSVMRNTDLPPEEWWVVAREVRALAQEGRRSYIQLDYGAPFDGPELPCETFAGRRAYVDARGRLSTCCQLSEYGNTESDVVADLHHVSLVDAWPVYVERLRAQQAMSAPRPEGGDAFDALPCIRCARSTGKMEWIREYSKSVWSGATDPHAGATRSLPVLAMEPVLVSGGVS
ncbi:MAG TPA: radical SAM protein [Gemmatimonadaceae bacterium]|jgi:MoaA/NifB/PqqE/SkfB family radical SAM enzyme|nr:radical SAM protein [Gemmatimonadaceae bacterium]